MAVGTPWDVVPEYRKCSYFVFLVLIAGYISLAVLSIKSTLNLYRTPVVMSSVQNSSPDLPYMYVCPSSRLTKFNSVIAGCGEDVLRELRPISVADQNPFMTNGTCMNANNVSLAAGRSTFLTDGNCSVGVANIKVIDRLLKRPVDYTCVTFHFRYAESLGPSHKVDWVGQFYVIYDLGYTLAADSLTTKKGIVSQALSAYFSDIGNASLDAKDCFIREETVRQQLTSPEKFEQGAVTLPGDMRSDFRLMKSQREFTNGVTAVKYSVDSGGVSTYAVNFVSSLKEGHGISTSSPLRDGVLMQVSISFDEVLQREHGLRTGLYNLLGSLGGQVTWFTAALGLIFVEIRDGPYLTMAIPWTAMIWVIRKARKRHANRTPLTPGSCQMNEQV